MPGSTHIAPDTESLFDALGNALMSAALAAVEERGVFHVALSGGGTPEPFYMRLVIDPIFRGLPWAKTHVWIVDERCVAEDHEKSNIKMIREALTDHVPTPRSQVHAMPVLDDDPATTYEAVLAEAFEMPPPVPTEVAPDATFRGGYPRFDFILLGMGGDCHTASLFPESPALTSSRWIDTNDGDKVVPPPRVTMTYPLINAGRHVAVLAVGGGKTAALQRVADQHASGEPDIENVPISGIAPKPGDLVWYLDEAAAG
ncbi:MAG: 6-phosphogluconolactonase [Planctomycetota bacterium]